MKRLATVIALFAFFYFPASGRGIEIDAIRAIKMITTDELKKLYDAKADFLLINTLSPVEFAEERIKGSINIPYMHLKSGAAKLPDDRNKMLIFYCKGPK